MIRYIILCLLLAFPAYAEEGADNAFSPKRGATELVVKTVEEAQQSVCVAAYSFTSEPIAQALLAARARGVAVKVTLDKSQSKGKKSILPQLQKSGLPVRINKHYAIMHDKFMVIDQKVLQLGSFNYTTNAETKNAENVLVIRRYKKVIASYTAECDRLWDEATEPAPLVDGQVPPEPPKPKKPRAKKFPKESPDLATAPIVTFPEPLQHP